MVSELGSHLEKQVLIRGWVFHLRKLSKFAFIVLKDCSGTVQCVVSAEILSKTPIKLDDAIEMVGKVRTESRSKQGYEIDVQTLTILNPCASQLPFNSSLDINAVNQETLLDYRPLSLRHPSIHPIFEIEADVVQAFRHYLRTHHFTEIFTSKIISKGTEGGTNLFELKYFDQLAYLAQSPQFYKEYGVAGLERVFETGHVYRAEPHATSRHLTEYYSLDLEMGFIDGVLDIIHLEKELLTYIFEQINQKHAEVLKQFVVPELPAMKDTPIWTFSDCLQKLEKHYQRKDLVDDLDPEAEKQLCELAMQETGIPAVFVLGFPLSSRPFYTKGEKGISYGFDLLFRGLEITTGGQRLHLRSDLEAALRSRKIDSASFEAHLKMFDLGMPPHGGLAIGLERLTSQILGLTNIRSATMYPRDKKRIDP